MNNKIWGFIYFLMIASFVFFYRATGMGVEEYLTLLIVTINLWAFAFYSKLKDDD